MESPDAAAGTPGQRPLADLREAPRAALTRLVQRYFGDDDARNTSHTVQLTSYGGCGTTALHEHLVAAGVNLPKSPGQWPYKHQRYPPDSASVPESFRVVYLIGDPRNAVMSYFRRGYQVDQYFAVRWVEEVPPDARARLVDLDTFVTGGVDDYELEQHFLSWWERPLPSYPVLFVRYEALAEAWPAILEFVGLPSTVEPFPLAERSSDWRSLPGALRDGISAMYAPLIDRIAALPSAHVH